MAENILTEREQYIDKLREQIGAIEKILNMDSGSVLSLDLKKQLKNLKKKAETVLHKLETNEYEIAVVGLEKAGKSTFANAFMENPLLPTKDERCTFTSTQIKYSDKDSATVSFYTHDEFERDFRDKLEKLGYPDYENVRFDFISKSAYESTYEDKVSQDKKRAYGESIHEDILAVIENRDSLSDLLDSSPILFNADEINSGKLGPYITDEAKARAVKQVVICSSKLSKMKNAVIFDVPGFNSPTEMHKIQTLERMKSADAIIVIANGGSPSITGDTLKILHQSDDDGNPLKDKLFVFANKIDHAEDIGENIRITEEEWIGKHFVSPENKDKRIFFGCARVHTGASDKGVDSRVLETFEKIKDQLPDGDGIDAIKSALEKYNQTERFEVLKRRINRFKADIEKTLRSVLPESDGSGQDILLYTPEILRSAANIIDGARAQIKEELDKLKNDLRITLRSQKPLSESIRKYAEENVTAERFELTDEMLKKISLAQNLAMGNVPLMTVVEAEARKQRFEEMYDDFSKNVINIANNGHGKCSQKIVDIFLDVLHVDSSSPYFEEIKTDLKKELSAYRSDLSESGSRNVAYYQSLIERFSRFIYEILILRPYTDERIDEFYDIINNLYSLSVFYRAPGTDENDLSYLNVTPANQPLCMTLLFHQYRNMSESVNSISDEISRASGLRNIASDICEAVKLAFMAVGNKAAIVNEVVSAISGVSDFMGKTDDFKLKIVRNTLNNIAERKPCSVADREKFSKYYKEFHSSLRTGSKPLDDVKEDFKDDIEILRDVLINAFINAIGMENPFMARELKSIDDIVKYLNGDSDESFRNFVVDNIYKLKYDDVRKMMSKRHEMESNRVIIDQIQTLLSTLNS